MQRPSVRVVIAGHQSKTGLTQETAGGLLTTRIPAKRTRITTGHLAELIAKVRSKPSYRDKARWFQQTIKETRGVDLAADIVEWAFRVRQRDAAVALAESRG